MTREEKWAEAERLIAHAKTCRKAFIDEMKMLQMECEELKAKHLTLTCQEENESAQREMRAGE